MVEGLSRCAVVAMGAAASCGRPVFAAIVAAALCFATSPVLAQSSAEPPPTRSFPSPSDQASPTGQAPASTPPAQPSPAPLGRRSPRQSGSASLRPSAPASSTQTGQPPAAVASSAPTQATRIPAAPPRRYDPSQVDRPPIDWTVHDEAWYRKNRILSGVGKGLTVAGILGFILTFSDAQRSDGRLGTAGFLGSILVQNFGQLTWASTDLRAAKVMRKKGVDVGKGAGIAGVVGATLLSPILWIAGPIQSAKLREAHRETVEQGIRGAGADAVRTNGLGVRIRF